jgi:malonyl-CoA/methylmalonyl-CoA synthetase
MNDNLYALLAARFPQNPDAPCLILPDGRRVSYGELESQSAQYGNMLDRGRTEAGRPRRRPGGEVARGAVPLSGLPARRWRLPAAESGLPARRGRVFPRRRQAGPFVCRPEKLEEAQELAWAARVPLVHDLGERGDGSLAAAAAEMPEAFSTTESAGSDLAAILYTSGTTGRSKGAMLTHRNLAANALVLHEYWGFRPGDVLLHMLPTFHVHGLFVATHCALLNGSPMLFEPKFDAQRALRLMREATVFMGVPTYYVRLLQEKGLTREAVAHMRLFISGSAPLLPETFSEFRERTGQTLLERYGMTEGGMFTSNPLEGERRGGTVGFPLPGTEVRVVGEDDVPQPVGGIGQIQVRGDNVFAGYWGMPEKTREEFTPDGFFRTGDMGRFDSEGYLAIIGRNKDLIITGGLNVYPKEIEEAIDALAGVAESAVIGLPHPDFGEAVTAVVVRREDGAGLTAEGIVAALKGQIAGFKVPKAVHFVDDLPRNAMGKVQKNLLRQRFAG